MNGNHETPVIAGAINKNVVVRNVKYEQWDEKEYPKKYYPLYPMGGFYIMSKSVVNYVGANYLKLKEYVIEDAALGVWVDDWMENEQTKAGLGSELGRGFRNCAARGWGETRGDSPRNNPKLKKLNSGFGVKSVPSLRKK